MPDTSACADNSATCSCIDSDWRRSAIQQPTARPASHVTTRSATPGASWPRAAHSAEPPLVRRWASTLVWRTTQSTSPVMRSPMEAPSDSALAALAVAALSAAEPPAQEASSRSRGAKGSFMMVAASTGAARRADGREDSSTCTVRMRSSSALRRASRSAQWRLAAVGELLERDTSEGRWPSRRPALYCAADRSRSTTPHSACTALSSSRNDCARRALDSVSLAGSALALLYATPSLFKTDRTGGHPETDMARTKRTVNEQGPPYTRPMAPNAAWHAA
mmetsp:Transcript_24167/g.78010  ORF Transcript_24167/g.78010 Transcript_24167/m.78010 type:complete len:278 (+) Transcript_24167:680-1513(+)